MTCYSRVFRSLAYLCDDAHDVVKHSHLRHPVLGQDGNVENTKIADRRGVRIIIVNEQFYTH